MARKIAFIVLLILCVVWTAFIFSNSLKDAGESGEQSSGVTEKVNEVAQAVGIDREITHSEVRSMAHFGEFAVLSVLSAATVSVGIYPKFKKKPPLLLLICASSVPLCFILAAVDELLQKLSDGRASQFSDVMLDTLGALCGALIFTLGYTVFDFTANKIQKTKGIFLKKR